MFESTDFADYPNEIKEKRFHGAGTDYNKCGVEIAKSAGFTPTLQKSEGFRVQASEGEVVVLYFEPSATQNLKSSGFPEG
jgi:hypothetical protein